MAIRDQDMLREARLKAMSDQDILDRGNRADEFMSFVDNALHANTSNMRIS